MDNKGIYIPSIDAKDIYLSAHYIEDNPDGYNLKLKDGQYNLRKFINSLDYSLDLIELLDIYYKKYRRNDFYFKVKKHKYTANVINLTFKYSVKEWNQMNKNTFVKFGYDYRNLSFEDCVAKNNMWRLRYNSFDWTARCVGYKIHIDLDKYWSKDLYIYVCDYINNDIETNTSTIQNQITNLMRQILGIAKNSNCASYRIMEMNLEDN